MNRPKKEIGLRIRLIREKLKLNQEEFGKLLNGTKKSSISAYEQGDATPKVENLPAIADLGGVSLDWLITGREQATKTTGEIAATIAPGNDGKKARLIAQAKKEERRSADLRRLIDWMDEEENKNQDFGWLLSRQLEKSNPSFSEFLKELEEKKWPGVNHQVAEPEQKYNNNEK